MSRPSTPAQRIEQGLLTEHRKALWRPFMQGIRRYRLIDPGDRIAVCLSGGKDSLLLAAMMRTLERRGEVPFAAVYLFMDPGYAPDARELAEANARALDIPLTAFESDVFEVANAQSRRPCFLCARMRRGCLYKKAQALGCNKIALGHHLNDVIETALMSMLYAGQLQAMRPKLRSEHFPGMQLIRPMYLTREADILTWSARTGLSFPDCACRFAQRDAAREERSRRRQVKALIARLEAETPGIERNLFGALHTVQLDTLPGWKHRGKRYSFLEEDGD